MQVYFPMVQSSFKTDEDGNPTGGKTLIFDHEDALNTGGSQPELATIVWQDGILKDGRNGILVEDLIEACLQRLRYFNDSKFRCRENSLAITDLESAQNWIRRRQFNRAAQGVQSSYETHNS